MSLSPAKRCRVQARGERPELFSPRSFSPSQTMANASLPIPLLVGSTTVRVMAAAMAASAALPPFSSIRRPAWAARGWEVATTLRARTGMRRDGYGKSQESSIVRFLTQVRTALNQ